MVKIKKIIAPVISLAVILIVSTVIFTNFLNTDIEASSDEAVPKYTDLSVSPEDSVYTDSLSFSHLPGIYTESFLLEMYTDMEGSVIRYTTDCTKPISTSVKYTDPVKISASKDAGDTVSASVIRAAVFGRDGNQIGGEVTATYLITDDPDLRYSSMIISIVSEPDGLYDYERGIMVEGKIADEFRKKRPDGWTTGNLNANYMQKGAEWEREAHIEFFEADGSLMMSQNGGIRISGGWTRANTQKSFRLFARDVYEPGKSLFYCDLFPGLTSISGEPVNEFKSILLRTGSNNNGSSVINNQAMMRLADETDICSMYSRFAAVYLNGKYYGIIGVYEDYSPQYYEAHYGIDRNYVTCITGTAPVSGGVIWKLDDGPDSEYNEFNAMLDFISKSDMTDEDNYKQACEMLDIENYIQYMCFGSYIGMSDWLTNNMRVWRYNKDGYNPDAEEFGYDGRWRFILKDMDSSGGYGHAAQTPLTTHINSDGALKMNNMFKSLFKNYEFSCKVAATYCDMMNSVFRPDRAIYSITETETAAMGEMQYFMNYYNLNGKRIAAWDNTLTSVRKFFIDRHEYAFKDLKRKFSVSWDKVMFNISEGGTVKLNTLTLDSSYNGVILDYLGEIECPFKIIPDEGWELKSFSIDGGTYYEAKGTVEFNALGDEVTVNVEFVKSAEYAAPEMPEGLVINEIKYQAIASETTPDWIEIYNNSEKSVYLQGYCLMYVKNGGSIKNVTDIKGTFKFPAIRIEPDEYIVVFCDGFENTSSKTSLHTKFKLATGYDIVLTANNQSDEIDRAALVDENIKTGESHSLARNPETGEWMKVAKTTPYERNIVESKEYSFISTVSNKAVYGKTLMNMTDLNSQFVVRDGKEGLWLDAAGMKKVFGGSISTLQMIDRMKGYEDDDGYYLMEDIMAELTAYDYVYIEALDLNLYLKTKN